VEAGLQSVPLSLPGSTRQSIEQASLFLLWWMPGSSPGMTIGL
jgi:hypothetical protein